MRGLSLLAIVACTLCPAGGRALAQASAQHELNVLTGAPADTKCFKSVALAQELATRYVVSGLCPQLRPMDPGQFLDALYAREAVDKDFASEACQLQFSLMFRLGREWAQQDPQERCSETVRKLSKLKRRNDIFRGLIR